MRWLSATEKAVAIAALTLMALLPAAEMISRQLGWPSIPGAGAIVQHLTLWVAFVGAAVAAGSGRLLSLSANAFLSEKWAPRVRIFSSGVAGAVTLSLAWASLEFVLAEREGGAVLGAGIPKWVALSVMPAAFLLVAVRAVWSASPSMRGRLVASLGLVVPLVFFLAPPPEGSAVLWTGIAVVVAAALLGLPIFATLGGLALLLFWNRGVPVASVPVETYRLVASPIFPSIPLFTFAGYLLVEGGASRRLLRVYTALLGWLPGGLAVTTALALAIFTWAGSGVTILALGGLLLPMLVKARYPEPVSIGLINASGSLGLLFPPSLPVIFYAMYARIGFDRLFVGGFLPGLVMVAMICAYGAWQGIRNRAGRAVFSGREARLAIWEAKWELAVPVIMLVGLFGGFGTLVEAGAITVLYSFLVERFAYREFSVRRDYARVALECSTVVGCVLMIIGVAVGLTNYLVDAQVPGVLIAWVQANIHSKYVFLLLLNLALVVKGSFMDVFSAIIVVVPLITPLGVHFGIDPVQLAIIFLANLELGYLTPPVGMNLCLSAYRFERPMSQVYRATLPYYVILLIGVLLITYVPALTTAPPHWMGY
ncbi:MAG TPA: TRAP transporter large permease subunit [Bryobacteraceae bacterium]|nr:TRAP transporter large permease subunit [Bryobacteraceae bacterium]